MKIKKFNKCKYNSNDIYLLEALKDKIIINNNESGVIFLNLSGEVLNLMDFHQSLYIYAVFKNFSNTAVLLYCPDEKTLIHCLYDDNKFNLVSCDNINGILSKCYYWKDNGFIILDYNFQFYQIDFDKMLIGQIEPADVKNNNLSFYNFCNEVKAYDNLYQINGTDGNFIACDQKSNKVTYYDYLSGYKKTINNPSFNYHDLMYVDGIFVFISETKIEIISDTGSMQLYPDSFHYIFIKASFVKKNEKLFLIVLIGCKNKPKVSQLLCYLIVI